MRGQIRGSSLLLAGRLISLAVNLAVQVMVVRYLSKNDYGAFAYALSIVALCESVVTLGLDRAVTRFAPIYHEQGDYRRLSGTLLLAGGVVAGLGLLVVGLVVSLKLSLGWSVPEGGRATTLLLILIGLAPVQAFDSLLTGLFAVLARPTAIFLRRYLLAPGLKLAVVAVVIAGHRDVVFLAWGHLLAGGLGAGLYATLLLRALRRQGLLSQMALAGMQVPIREVFGFTLPLLTSDLLYVAMNSVDVVLLGHFGGTQDVAAFRAVQPAARLNQLVMTSFALLFTPAAARLLARKDRSGINQLYWHTAVWVAVLSFPIFALTFSLAEPLTVALFGQRYRASAAILALLSLGYYFNAALGHNGLTLKVFAHVRYVVAINLLAVGCNLALNLMLIPRFGALGAAGGTCATLILHNVLKQAGLRMGTGISLFEPGCVRVYASVAAAAVALLATQLLASPDWPVGLLLAALASLGVVAVSHGQLNASATFPELRRAMPAWLLRDRPVMAQG